MHRLSRSFSLCSLRPSHQFRLSSTTSLRSSRMVIPARNPRVTFSTEFPKIGENLKDSSPYAHSILQQAIKDMEKDDILKKATGERDLGGPDLSVVEQQLRKGFDMAQNGQLPQAIKWLTKCAEDEPTIPIFFVARSRMYEMNGNFQSAIRDLEKALFLVPGNAHIITQLASLYATKGDTEKAFAILSRVPQSDFGARQVKAMILQQLGKYSEALEEILPAFPQDEGTEAEAKKEDEERKRRSFAPLPALPTNINVPKEKEAPKEISAQVSAAILAADLFMMLGMPSYSLAYYTRVHQITLRHLFRSVLTPEEQEQDISTLKLSGISQQLAAPNSSIHSPLFRPHVCSLEGLGQYALSCADWRTAATHFTAALTLLDPHVKLVTSAPKNSSSSTDSIQWVLELSVQLYCKRAVAHLNAGNARRAQVDTSVALKMISDTKPPSKSGLRGDTDDKTNPMSSDLKLSELMALFTRGSAEAVLKEWESAYQDLTRGLEINQRSPQLASLPDASLVDLRTARLTSLLHLILKDVKVASDSSKDTSSWMPSVLELRQLQSQILDRPSSGSTVSEDQLRVLYAFDDAAFLREKGYPIPNELIPMLRKTIQLAVTISQ